jgi:hypothetical protein
MNVNEVTLGDLTGTGGNPAIDVLIDKLFNRKPKPSPILVESDGVFQWARPVVTADDGRMVSAPKVA